jgi:arginyl-tRNA synthetase
VGSIIFNDIKKDKRYPVEVQEDLRKMHEEFERSGGAYVVYTACRARSIIRKWGKAVPAITECPGALELDPAEIELIKELSLYPQKLAEAARTDSPSVLAQYLLDLSRSYNSYYASFPVIKGDVVHEHRLVITKAVQTVLENGLKICAIECPERI